MIFNYDDSSTRFPSGRQNALASIGLTEYASMTRMAIPSSSSFDAAFSASCTVIPAAITVARSLADFRRTLDPPIGNCSLFEYRTAVFGRVVRM